MHPVYRYILFGRETRRLDCKFDIAVLWLIGESTACSQARRSMKQIETAVSLSGIVFSADLTVPRCAKGLVLFAHGSGSSRHSPRNRHVADVLNRGQIGTVLIDLLTSKEETVDLQSAKFRFDIPRLGRRLIEITDCAGFGRIVAQRSARSNIIHSRRERFSRTGTQPLRHGPASSQYRTEARNYPGSHSPL